MPTRPPCSTEDFDAQLLVWHRVHEVPFTRLRGRPSSASSSCRTEACLLVIYVNDVSRHPGTQACVTCRSSHQGMGIACRRWRGLPKTFVGVTADPLSPAADGMPSHCCAWIRQLAVRCVGTSAAGGPACADVSIGITLQHADPLSPAVLWCHSTSRLAHVQACWCNCGDVCDKMAQSPTMALCMSLSSSTSCAMMNCSEFHLTCVDRGRWSAAASAITHADDGTTAA